MYQVWNFKCESFFKEVNSRDLEKKKRKCCRESDMLIPRTRGCDQKTIIESGGLI
jgi:hypothetical protein